MTSQRMIAADPASSPPASIRLVPRVVDPAALCYSVLSPRATGAAERELVAAAYRCWSGVWTKTLHELDGVRSVPSDEFSRQDEIGALFHDDECIGLTAYRWVDLSSPLHADDSYFRVWPSSARAAASAHGARVCIGSNLTVAAPWRSSAGLSIKEILLALAIDRFLASDASTMVGTMRNDRGMNGLAYRLGFAPVAQGLLHHGVRVDLVAFHRDAGARPPLSPETEDTLRALRAWEAA